MFCGRGLGGNGGNAYTYSRAFVRTAGSKRVGASSSGATSPPRRFAEQHNSSNSHAFTSNPITCQNKNAVSDPHVCDDDPDWVIGDILEDELIHPFPLHFPFGPVPSEDEVEHAVAGLTKVFGPDSNVQHYKDNDMVVDHVITPVLQTSSDDGSEKDWIEPALSSVYDSRMVRSDAIERVHHAFFLLQTEPDVQRMVKSLSTDQALWDAVMNNEVVQELGESIPSDKEKAVKSPKEISSDNSDTTTNVVLWLFNNARAQCMKVIEALTMVFTQLFLPANHGDSSELLFPEKLKNSVVLTIMVLLVVVVTRAQKA